MKQSEEPSGETDGTERGSRPCHSLGSADLGWVINFSELSFSSHESAVRGELEKSTVNLQHV